MNILKKINPANSSAAKKTTYVVSCGILKTIVKMADQKGLSDIHEVNHWIQSMSVDEFCGYKFDEPSDPDLIEGE